MQEFPELNVQYDFSYCSDLVELYLEVEAESFIEDGNFSCRQFSGSLTIMLLLYSYLLRRLGRLMYNRIAGLVVLYLISLKR